MTPKRVVFMKVGHHAEESWSEVVARKAQEYRDAGAIFWGYGGTLCHPLRQVQALVAGADDDIFVAMQATKSHTNPALPDSTGYSTDGMLWHPLPVGVHVRGSRYALVLDRVQEVEEVLDSAHYAVAIGPSAGRSAAGYIRNRVDKGCFVLRPDAGAASRPWAINFVARLRAPYAVLVR